MTQLRVSILRVLRNRKLGKECLILLHLALIVDSQTLNLLLGHIHYWKCGLLRNLVLNYTKRLVGHFEVIQKVLISSSVQFLA